MHFWFSSSFSLWLIIYLMNKDTLVLLLIFWNMSYYFGMITLIKNANNFQIAKFSFRVVLGICLIICQSYLALPIKVLPIKKHLYNLKQPFMLQFQSYWVFKFWSCNGTEDFPRVLSFWGPGCPRVPGLALTFLTCQKDVSHILINLIILIK